MLASEVSATDAGSDRAVVRTVAARRAPRRAVAVAVLGGLLFVAIVLSLAIGAKSIPTGTVLEAFTDFDSSNADHLVVRELRLPRTIVGLLVGVALGVSGAVMQAVTRNSLADFPDSPASREPRAKCRLWRSSLQPTSSPPVAALSLSQL